MYRKNYFRIIGSAATRERDKFHIRKHLSEGILLNDVTDDYCVLGLFGPKSRELMSNISKDEFSNEKFKFSTAKNINIDGIEVWAQRLSYVGELGFELYVKTSDSKKLYEFIIKKGKNYNIVKLWNACNGYYENGKWFFTLGTRYISWQKILISSRLKFYNKL